MTTEAARLHITFGYSAAGSLKTALSTLGLSEEVAILGDDYSMGPIDPGDADQRAEWERDELGEDDPIAISADVTAFWKKVSSWPGRLVAWMSSHSVHELCGLHELLWRLPAADIHVVDAASINFSRGNAPRYDERQAFAIVRDDRVVELSLLGSAKPLSEVERAAYRKNWKRLRAENAPLRVLTKTGLASAAVDHFDDRIRARITDDWQRCARIVGDMLGSVSSGMLREGGTDTFFFVRLLSLIDEAEDIEGKNDDGPDALWSMRSSWVRRRTRG